MLKYLLKGELDLIKTVLISQIEWYTLNLHGDEEGERKWWPLGWLGFSISGFAFWNIHILIDLCPGEFPLLQGIMEEEIYR